jgi:uncharacterized protein (TIGR03000 family)
MPGRQRRQAFSVQGGYDGMYSVILATALTVSAGSTGWCHGCRGCWGGCYGCSGYAFTSCYGCWGCYGGCYGFGCHGCYGCWGCYGYSSYYVPTVAYYAPAVYVAPAGGFVVSVVAQSSQPAGSSQTEVARLRAEVETLRQQAEMQKKKPGLGEIRTASTGQAAPAKLTVHLPADAKLFVDDIACPLTSETRSFDTPQLRPGQKFFYDMRAEVVRGGAPVSQTQRVVIEAGQQVSVTFPQLAPVTAAARP